ncbi:MAG: hypothetical protein E7458_03930 [Ruminococcaceae bacterium]|nr:hypothetical protein [Oscillospiraceae bacterium]
MKKKKTRLQMTPPAEEPGMDGIRQAELVAEMEEALSALQALHPEVESIEALLEDEQGEALLENMDRLGDLVAAYRLTYFEELLDEARAQAEEQAIQAERARYAAASRKAGKGHLQRTLPRGGTGTELTQAILEAYRLFDPAVTADEVRAYESAYRKRKKK